MQNPIIITNDTDTRFFGGKSLGVVEGTSNRAGKAAYAFFAIDRDFHGLQKELPTF
jgi:hypothetical protein